MKKTKNIDMILRPVLEKLHPSGDKVISVKFNGMDLVLVGDFVHGGALATREAYEDFEASFAHLMENGIIVRYGFPIGTKEDLVYENQTGSGGG